MQLYRITRRPRIFAIEVFAILVAYSIKKTFRKENQYVIDREYIEKDDDIKRFILLSLEDLQIPIDKGQIHFDFIGKKSKAHITSYYAYQDPRKAQKISIHKILRLIHP